MINDYRARWFDTSQNLSSDTMKRFIGYARWVVFDDDDTSLLHLERNKQEEAYLDS